MTFTCPLTFILSPVVGGEGRVSLPPLPTGRQAVGRGGGEKVIFFSRKGR
jgi:hypothetical protein